MTTARLLSTIELFDGTGDEAANNAIRITDGSTPETITIPAAVYVLEGDQSADDFWKAFKTAADALHAGTWTIEIIGPQVTSATEAEGRVKYTHSASDMQFLLDDGLTTIDPRILGYADGTQPMSSSTMVSDMVHRYGYYPAISAATDDERTLRDSEIHVTSGRYADGADWGEYDVAEFGFDARQSPLIRIKAAADSARVTGTLMVAPDTNAPLERFNLDLSGDRTRRFYYYSDVTSMTRSGPFIFPRRSILWKDPLGESVRTHRVGELWMAVIKGISPGA